MELFFIKNQYIKITYLTRFLARGKIMLALDSGAKTRNEKRKVIYLFDFIKLIDEMAHFD